MEKPITGLRSIKKPIPKTAHLNFRLTPEELVAIATAAELENLSPADFVRKVMAAQSAAIIAAHEKPARKKKS